MKRVEVITANAELQRAGISVYVFEGMTIEDARNPSTPTSETGR